VLIIPTAIAPATGPIIGGLLVDWLSWRWVFYVNLPLGIAAFIFGWIFLVEHKEPRAGGFDLPGFVLSGGGLALILFALSQGPVHGWLAPGTLIPGVIGVSAFVALVIVELRLKYPMLQLRLISDRLFRDTMLTSTFSTAAFLGVLFAIPIFLQEIRGASALESGLTTFPEAIGVLTFGQVAGRIYPTIGPRRLMSGGLLAVALLLLSLTTVTLETSDWMIRGQMFLIGASMSFCFISLQACAFARIPAADTGRASAIYNTQRQMASALGVAILATVLSARLPDPASAASPSFASDSVNAFHAVFLTAAGLAFIGSLVALRVRDIDAEATMRRRAEPQVTEPA
jgi:EmrB/QacA subfamily drug resistance transporter